MAQQTNPASMSRALNALMGASHALLIVPGDTGAADLADGACDAIWVGVAGDVNVLHEKDAAPILYKNVPVGRLDVRAIRIYATSTTATFMVAMY